MTGVDSATLTEEDQSRAALYALLGRLFYDAPDAALLQRFGAVMSDVDAGTPVGAAWRALAAACRDADPEAVRDEHQRLFVGVGKSLVTPYTSAYVTHTPPDRHLLALRRQLAAWGLARPDSATDTEDHVAGLCDVMRHLIGRGESDQVQKEFFNENIYLCINPLCGKLLATDAAKFYKEVARFALAFLEVEREAFDMLDTEA